MENLKKIFSKKNHPKLLAFLLALFLVFGIFLRTHNFSDWLRFNKDQARDAEVVSNFLEGENSLPLLGPKAGGTDFRLGPIFYYFQIASAKIFDSSPDRLAYPDLLFSILAIGMFYLLMRRYFNVYISVALSCLMSVSMFVVQYSRFAWNPNSSPFFTLLFLYSFLMLADAGSKKRFFWASIAGFSLGVSMQLHTLLLAVMPLIAVVFSIYLYKKKNLTAREFAAVLLLALALNVPQAISEFQTKGENLRSFFSASITKTSNEKGIVGKMVENVLCQEQGNRYIISAIGPSGDCGRNVISSELKKHKHFDKRLPVILGTFLGLIFTIGGIFLWVKSAIKEKEKKKRDFLFFLGTYFLVIFVFLIPLANEISARFYLMLEFVPFLLLGFWAEAAWQWPKEKNKKLAAAVLIFTFAFLAASNIHKTSKMFSAFSSQEDIEDDNVDNDSESFITLSEARFIADFIVSHAGKSKVVYLEGRQVYLFKYVRPIEYFTSKEGVEIIEYSEKEKVPEDAIVISIGSFKNEGKVDKAMRENYSAQDSASKGRFSVTLLAKSD